MSYQIPLSGAGIKTPERSGSSGLYQVEVVSDPESLAALRPVWNSLMEEAGIDHPFATHEWITSWWGCFGEGKRLHVVLLKSEGRIRAILPLMISRESWYGLKFRRIGTFFNLHTPRFDFLVPREMAERAYNSLWLHLKEIRGAWDVLELCPMTGNGGAIEELARFAVADGYDTGHWSPGGSPYVPTTGQWDDYLLALGKNHRSNHRRRLRRLGDLGELKMETVTSESEIDNALADGFRIEAMAWKGSAGTAILSDPVLQRFYRDSSRKLVRQGWLKLYFLVIDGRRIAFQYCLQYQGRIFLIKPGYDPEFARYSPSHLLTWLILEDAFGSDTLEYDFLGSEDPWKLSWARHKRPQRWLYIFADSLYGSLLHAAKFRLLPAIKRMMKK